jgi:hypothetical protein
MTPDVNYENAFYGQLARVKELEAENRRLREALEEAVELSDDLRLHDYDCLDRHGRTYSVYLEKKDCTCGLIEKHDKLKAALE